MIINDQGNKEFAPRRHPPAKLPDIATFGESLRQKLRCSFGVLNIHLSLLLASSLRFIQTQNSLTRTLFFGGFGHFTLANFVELALKARNIAELAVNAGKADVGDFVKITQASHD
jgi:hypothetical protein